MTEAVVRSEPKFSILLPTHNRSDVLRFAIRSVLAQTLTDFELLIVGDGCTDDTAQVVKGFGDSRIIWFDLPKAPGYGYANRNVALKTARGDLIAFMAHDDLWFPDHLERMSPMFADQSVEIAYSRPLWVIPKGLLAPGTFNLEHGTTLKSFLDGGVNRIPAACVIHRRKCFARYGYWNESLPSSADLDMWVRIIKGGGPNNVVYLTEPTSLHFRANWRTEATTGQPQLLVWKQLHSLESFMPAALKIHIPDGLSEQEAIWNNIAAEPQDWVKQVRSGVRQALDHRISHSDELMVALLKLEPSLAPTDDLSEPLARFTSVLDFSQASLEWKVTRVLVAGKRRALPPGTMRGRIWSRIVRSLHS